MKAEKFNLDDYIMHHIMDSQEWHLPFLPVIHLPEYISLHGLMVGIGSSILTLLFCFIYKKDQKVPTGITNLLEAFIVFIRNDIIIPNIGEKHYRPYIPFFCTMFFFILILNLMGLIPLFVTATANVSVTAALALVTLSFMMIGTICKTGIKGFFKALSPSGVPIPILFVIVPLEFLGMFVKALALTLRLFANMMAGHIVLLSLLGLFVVAGIKAFPAIILVLFIYALEILVAFIQAYVFTLLSAMFIGHMHYPHH